MKKVIVAFFFLLVAVFATSSLNKNSINLFKPSGSPQVTINKITFYVSVAKTQTQQEKGLAGRDSMPQNEGMIFLFEKPDYYGFWMVGMKFPLDMVFIKNDKIVEIFTNVPVKNPNSVENPKEMVDKVLEINAGLSKKYNFKIGDNVKMSL